MTRRSRKNHQDCSNIALNCHFWPNLTPQVKLMSWMLPTIGRTYLLSQNLTWVVKYSRMSNLMWSVNFLTTCVKHLTPDIKSFYRRGQIVTFKSKWMSDIYVWHQIFEWLHQYLTSVKFWCPTSNFDVVDASTQLILPKSYYNSSKVTSQSILGHWLDEPD